MNRYVGVVCCKIHFIPNGCVGENSSPAPCLLLLMLFIHLLGNKIFVEKPFKQI